MAEDGDVSSELHQRFLHFLAPDDSGEYLVFYSGSCVVNLVWRALVHFVTWSVSARAVGRGQAVGRGLVAGTDTLGRIRWKAVGRSLLGLLFA